MATHTNTLTNIMPLILAAAVEGLREQVMFVRTINHDYSREAAEKGDVINVPIPVAKTAKAVTPSNTPPVADNHSDEKVQIPLDQWFHSDFALNDQEVTQIQARRHFIPMDMAESLRALAFNVNAYMLGKYTGVYGFAGTAGTTPFASSTAEARAARKTLNQQLCPRRDRRMLIDHDAEENALGLTPFTDASASTDAGPIIDGEIGRKLGMAWLNEDQIPTHTNTGGAGFLVNTGSAAVGDKTLVVDTGSTAPAAGDVFTIAGDTQTYVITAATTTLFTFKPGLKVAPADNAAITFKADHVVNLAYHRNAFAFASRPLIDSVADLVANSGEPVRQLSTTDPVSGLTIRLELLRQYKQWVWDLDILYGGALVREEYVTRVAG